MHNFFGVELFICIWKKGIVSLNDKDLTRPHVLFLDHTGKMGGAEFSLIGLVQNLPVLSRVTLLSHGPLLEKLRESDISVGVLEKAESLVSLGSETSMAARLWAARRMPLLVWRLARQAGVHNLIYVNTKKALLFGIISAWITGKPLIWHQRDEMRSPASLPLRARLSEKLLVSLINRHVERIISVSQACADAFIAAGGRKDLPVVIHNGIDPACYTMVIDRSKIRARAGLPANALILGCFGRLTFWKGQSDLIKALSMLPDVHLALIGGTALGERGYETKLRTQAEHLQIADRVHFMGHCDNIPELMQAMDVIVHPANAFDPCPRVVIETLHSAVPLIATAVGGIPELVEDGKSGLLVPPSNPKAIVKAILLILSDSTLSEYLSREGRCRALKFFTINRVIAEVNREIRAVVCKNGLGGTIA